MTGTKKATPLPLTLNLAHLLLTQVISLYRLKTALALHLEKLALMIIHLAMYL